MIATKPLVGADLQFDAATHVYRRPDGQIVPSVTQILSAVKVSTDFEELKARGGKLAAAIERKRAIGKAVHADAHAYDDHDLDWNTVHPDVLPYLTAWVEFRQNFRMLPIQRERRLYMPALGACGTLDGVCCQDTDLDRHILIDIKTGDPEDAAARYQTAAYELLWNHEHPDQPIAERWSVELTPERSISYRVHPYSDWSDGAAFRAFVTTFYCQAVRRTRT